MPALEPFCRNVLLFQWSLERCYSSRSAGLVQTSIPEAVVLQVCTSQGSYAAIN